MHTVLFLTCCILIYDASNVFHSEAKDSTKCPICPNVVGVDSKMSMEVKFGKPVIRPCKHNKDKKLKLKKKAFFRKRRSPPSLKNTKIDTVENGNYRAVNIALPTLPEHNMTEIATKHFLIRIVTGNRKGKGKLDPTKMFNIEDSGAHKKVVVIDKPFERYQPQDINVSEGSTKSTVKDDNQKIDDDDKNLMREAIMGEIISRITNLPRDTSDNSSNLSSGQSAKAGGGNSNKLALSVKSEGQNVNKLDQSAKAGNKNTKAGNKNAKAGNKIAKTGYKNVKAGDTNTKDGDKNVKAGDTDAEDEDKSAKTGDKIAKAGYKNTKAGDTNAEDGDKNVKDGDKNAKTGDKIAKAGYKNVKTGDTNAKDGDKNVKDGDKSANDEDKSLEVGYKSSKADDQKINKTESSKGDDQKLDKLEKLKSMINKNKKLTDMFVTFVTELSGRLKLDNLQVAEKLINHVDTEKKHEGIDSPGTERDTVPNTRKQYTNIMNDLLSFVDDEINTAVAIKRY